MATVRLKDVLNAWDKIEKGNTEQSFSIGFVMKNGELRYFNRAVKAGTGYSLKDNEHRACVQVDEEGNKTGHITPFSIWRMVQFNGKKVIL